MNLTNFHSILKDGTTVVTRVSLQSVLSFLNRARRVFQHTSSRRSLRANYAKVITRQSYLVRHRSHHLTNNQYDRRRKFLRSVTNDYHVVYRRSTIGTRHTTPLNNSLTVSRTLVRACPFSRGFSVLSFCRGGSSLPINTISTKASNSAQHECSQLSSVVSSDHSSLEMSSLEAFVVGLVFAPLADQIFK